MPKCGPWWFPDRVKGWLSKDFDDSCGVHDEMYEQQEGRIKSDVLFLYLMLNEADQSKVGVFKKKLKAWFYFILVLAFGFISYNREKYLRRNEK